MSIYNNKKFTIISIPSVMLNGKCYPQTIPMLICGTISPPNIHEHFSMTIITSLNCIVTYASQECFNAAKKLAAELCLPFEERPSNNILWRLVVTPVRLELHHQNNIFGGPIYVDFLSGAVAYRQKKGGGKQQLLAKAVGIKSSVKPTILDATAGLGRDAFVFACLGCKVQMLERAPIIAALLSDGLARANQDQDFIQKCSMSLVLANSINYLSKLKITLESQRHMAQENIINEELAPDVIYLDPMYPERTKSALVKKELRALKAIVGTDLDSNELLKNALQIAQKRVVVKRPKLAPHLNNLKPTIIYYGDSTRYDVYFPSAL